MPNNMMQTSLTTTFNPPIEAVWDLIRQRTRAILRKSMNEYISNLSSRMWEQLYQAAPPPNPWRTGGIKEHIVTNPIKNTVRDAAVEIAVRTPYAIYTNKWPRPHLVPADKYPIIREWAEAHGQPLKDNKYLMVYGSSASGLRTPEGWFERAIDDAYNSYPIEELVKIVERTWHTDIRSAAARLGWITRRRRMAGLPAPPLNLKEHGYLVGWKG